MRGVAIVPEPTFEQCRDVFLEEFVEVARRRGRHAGLRVHQRRARRPARVRAGAARPDAARSSVDGLGIANRPCHRGTGRWYGVAMSGGEGFGPVGPAAADGPPFAVAGAVAGGVGWCPVGVGVVHGVECDGSSGAGAGAGAAGCGGGCVVVPGGGGVGAGVAGGGHGDGGCGGEGAGEGAGGVVLVRGGCGAGGGAGSGGVGSDGGVPGAGAGEAEVPVVDPDRRGGGAAAARRRRHPDLEPHPPRPAPTPAPAPPTTGPTAVEFGHVPRDARHRTSTSTTARRSPSAESTPARTCTSTRAAGRASWGSSGRARLGSPSSTSRPTRRARRRPRTTTSTPRTSPCCRSSRSIVCVRFTDQQRRSVMTIGPSSGTGFPVSYITWAAGLTLPARRLWCARGATATVWPWRPGERGAASGCRTRDTRGPPRLDAGRRRPGSAPSERAGGRRPHGKPLRAHRR